jgi:ketosteroid isomerase-like protein
VLPGFEAGIESVAMSPCERLVRRFFDLFAHAEVERLLAMVHPEAAFEPATPMEGEKRYEGLEEIERWLRWAVTQRPVQLGTAHAVDVLDEEHVLAKGRVRVKRGNLQADSEAAWLIQVREGKLHRWQARWTAEEALALHEQQHSA